MTLVLDGKGFKAADFIGTSIGITPVEYRPRIPTVHGDRPAWKVNVTILSSDDEAEAGTIFESVLIFQKALMEQIKRADEAGEPLVGTLECVPSKNKDEKGNPYVYFSVAESTSAERRAAAKYRV